MTITITSKTFGSFEVIYDDDMHDLVKSRHWYPAKMGKNVYAASWSPERTILMHRLILNLSDPKTLVDHANRNSLDNRKSNLRIATKSQNAQNITIPKTNRSGYKGVAKIERKGRKTCYIARIYVNNVMYHLGSFKDPKEAALAYNKAAIESFGEYACINNITSLVDAKHTGD